MFFFNYYYYYYFFFNLGGGGGGGCASDTLCKNKRIKMENTFFLRSEDRGGQGRSSDQDKHCMSQVKIEVLVLLF